MVAKKLLVDDNHGNSLCQTNMSPGARFSKVAVINGPGKLSPFTLKTEVSIVLHITRQNCQLMKQNGVVC